MSFSSNRYDPETLALIKYAFEEAWGEVQQKLSVGLFETEDNAAIRAKLALHIPIAAEDGVRDLEKLKQLALLSIDARRPD